MNALNTRREEHLHLGKLRDAVDATIAELTQRKVLQRIWSHDHTLWQEDPTEISNRLGWLHSPTEMQSQVELIESFTTQVRADGITHVLWCGMGGSSLFPMVLTQAFKKRDRGLHFQVLDTSNPVTMQRATDTLPLDKTLFMFASKSGGTIETRSHLDYYWKYVNNPRQFAVVTDSGSSLDEFATGKGFREVFHNNPDIGGRYSALSHFGLVPAGLLGIDIAELLQNTANMMSNCSQSIAEFDNPALRLGSILASAAKSGQDKCTLLMPSEISNFASWLEQLVAESTGKNGLGILPIVDEDLGPAGVYGNDRLFISFGETLGLDTLIEAGYPVVNLDYSDPMDIGGEVFRWELATAIAGVVLKINPFDQPNVEATKKAANKALAGDTPDIPTQSLDSILDQINSGDYIAIQAYIDADSAQLNALQETRMALRDRYHVATTLGLGPRYLHSTGQLHKGGSRTGVFIQTVADTEADVPIPGQNYGFSELIQAQAAGDYIALKEAGMRVARVSLEELLRYKG